MSLGSIEDLEREIEETRRALDRTLHDLQFELSPRHQLDLAWRFARKRTERGLNSTARWARANPVPMTLAAFAVAGVLVASATFIKRRRR